MDVVGTVIRRQRHSRQHHPDAGLLKRRDHLLHVRPRRLDRETPKSIVPAEFQNQICRLVNSRIAAGIRAHAPLVVSPLIPWFTMRYR